MTPEEAVEALGGDMSKAEVIETCQEKVAGKTCNKELPCKFHPKK
jgi:hypothetical protein